jgi:hypothetical protein
LAASAQELYQVTYSWNEVLAGTITPGNGNSVVDPGEGARIRLGVTALINGTNAVGQTINYTNPAPPGIGTVRGLGSVVYDLVGDGNGATANGTWMAPGPGFLGPAAPFTNGQTPGTPQAGGSSVHGMGGSQFISPGGTANGVNNNQQLFRGVWTPANYANRTVNFLARGSILVPAGQHNSVLLAYGTGTGIDPTTGEPFNFDQLVGKYFQTNFGQGLNIPIAPAPSSIALLGLGALIAGGRRRS